MKANIKLLTDEQKDGIMDAVRSWLASNPQISQNDMQKATGVSYLSYMLNHKYAINGTDIVDKYFLSLADYIGYKANKDYWPVVATPQLKKIIENLEDAKKNAKTKMLIGESGCGKSYAIKIFRQVNPVGTYVVTCSGQTSVSSLLRRIMDEMRIGYKGDNDYLIDRISGELRDRQLDGLNPVIIFDEAENLRINTIKVMKTIYDYLKGYCGIVLVGTDQLINTMEKLNSRNVTGSRQFFSRFIMGKRVLSPIDLNIFMDKYQLPGDLRRLISKICFDYRGLNDVLEPALRESDEQQLPLTEKFFRIVNDIN